MIYCCPTRRRPPQTLDGGADSIEVFLKIWTRCFRTGSLVQNLYSQVASPGSQIHPSQLPLRLLLSRWLKGPQNQCRILSSKPLAVEVNHSDWICAAMDQLLDTGRVFNDEATGVAPGAKSPDDAVKAIENSWFRKSDLTSQASRRGRVN